MKIFLKIVLGIIVILFVIGLFLPDDKKDLLKKEETENEKKALKNNSEWFATKESRKEKFIEKRIEGEWDRTFSIRYDTKEFDKETYEKGKGNYYHEKFIEAMLPKYYYEFSSKQGIKKNDDPLSYSVDKTSITFINPLAENEKEIVFFIGKGLMVRNAEIGSIKLGGYDFYKKVSNDNQEDYQKELTDFLGSLLYEGADKVKEAASLINANNSNEGYSKLTDGVSLLRIVSLADTSMKKQTSVLLAGIKAEFSSNFDAYINNEINSLKEEISSSKTEDWKIEYLEKYQNRLSYLNNLKFIGATIGINTAKIDNAYKEVENKFDAETKNVKLYGDGEQGMMKYAAMDYIKMIAKNPKSIDVIRSGVSRKTSKGIVYTVVFRGENSFGGYSIETVSVLLNFDIGSRTYFFVRQL